MTDNQAKKLALSVARRIERRSLLDYMTGDAVKIEIYWEHVIIYFEFWEIDRGSLRFEFEKRLRLLTFTAYQMVGDEDEIMADFKNAFADRLDAKLSPLVKEAQKKLMELMDRLDRQRSLEELFGSELMDGNYKEVA